MRGLFFFFFSISSHRISYFERMNLSNVYNVQSICRKFDRADKGGMVAYYLFTCIPSKISKICSFTCAEIWKMWLTCTCRSVGCVLKMK